MEPKEPTWEHLPVTCCFSVLFQKKKRGIYIKNPYQNNVERYEGSHWNVRKLLTGFWPCLKPDTMLCPTGYCVW